MSPVQILSIAIYGLLAILYVAPALKKLERGAALSWLVGLHVFRYCVLYVYLAQREGYNITDRAAAGLVVGDLAGAAIALVAVILLRARLRLGIAASWLVVAATLADIVAGLYQRSIDPPHGPPSGTWWLIFSFYAPALFVSLPVLVWQLVTRRREALAGGTSHAPRQ
jgi:hypothetical protein